MQSFQLVFAHAVMLELLVGKDHEKPLLAGTTVLPGGAPSDSPWQLAPIASHYQSPCRLLEKPAS